MDDIRQLRRRRITQVRPDLTAKIDEKDHITDVTDADLQPQPSIIFPKPDQKKPRRLPSWKKLSRKQKIITVVAAVMLVAIIVVSIPFLTHHSKPVEKATKKTVTKSSIVVKPAVIASPLSGLPVTLAQSLLPVTAVMIENSDEARPQSGLSQAGVIFEALAEGGITRFVALFQEGNPSSIGPIRSARPYFIDWMLPFDAAYVHVGGSADALSQITTDNVKDLNQFYNGSAFIRIASREAPHNVYSSMSALSELEKSKGYTSSTFSGFPRKKDTPTSSPTATKIDFNIEGPDVKVHYDYDAKNNAYLRSEGGQPMIDANTNQQLEPKVVVGLVVPLSQGALDASDAYYSNYADIGTGEAVVFQDGTVTVGTWSKSSPQSQIKLLDSKGNPILLNAGQVWFTALSSSSLITYSN